MLNVNETVTGYDPAELLEGESGVFKAISPDGKEFQFVVRPGHSIKAKSSDGKEFQFVVRPDDSITNIPPIEPEFAHKVWLIRKISELRLEPRMTASARRRPTATQHS